MKLIKLGDLFDVQYPSTLIFNQQEKTIDGIPFISSKGTNNGIAGFVKKQKNIKIYPKGAITVPLKGTVLQAFVQENEFYCAHQIAVLVQKEEFVMSPAEKIYYCECIKANKYRYSYGRQADRTLKDIMVPHPDEIPAYVHEVDFNKYDNLLGSITNEHLELNIKDWKSFLYEDLFDIKKGLRLTKTDMIGGQIPFIGSTDRNNGLTARVGQAPIHKGNTITVNYNGSVGEAFYQAEAFWASDDVNVLYPKEDVFPFFNQYVALFLIPLIKTEKYRFNYGRKWHKERMEKTRICVPVDNDGRPDSQYMEDYIKALPFSKAI